MGNGTLMAADKPQGSTWTPTGRGLGADPRCTGDLGGYDMVRESPSQVPSAGTSGLT